MADRDTLNALLDGSRDERFEALVKIVKQHHHATEVMEASTQRHAGLTEWRTHIERWMASMDRNLHLIISNEEKAKNDRESLRAELEAIVIESARTEAHAAARQAASAIMSRVFWKEVRLWLAMASALALSIYEFRAALGIDADWFLHMLGFEGDWDGRE